MAKVSLLSILFLSVFPKDIACQNFTEEPPSIIAQTGQPEVTDDVSTSRSLSWEPYATLYSGSQAFYSPPNYGKRISKPLKTPISYNSELMNMLFNQQFSGFSNREPPLEIYEEIEVPNDSYGVLNENIFNPFPSFHYSTPASYDFEPSRTPSNTKSSAYGSYVPGASKNNIPTYIEPPLKAFPEEEEQKGNSLNQPTGDVYNLLVYNDMSSTDSPEDHREKIRDQEPGKYSQHHDNFHPVAGSSPLKPIRNPYQNLDAHRRPFRNNHFRTFKFNRNRGFFKRRRKLPRPKRRKKYRGRNYRPRPPLRKPPGRYKEYQMQSHKEPNSVMHRVGPMAALATLIPIGLILSSFTPTFLGKRKRRSTNGKVRLYPTFSAIDKYGSENMDGICLQRIFCEARIEEGTSKFNVAIKLITYILAKLKNNQKELFQLKTATASSVHKKDCSNFTCKPDSKSALSTKHS